MRGDARTGGGERPSGFGNVGAASGNGVPCAPGHADPDGTESVEAWTCVEGCPVAELDRQSGVLTPNAVSRPTPRGLGYGGGAGSTLETRPKDVGGASRFFPQFPTDDPDAPWSEALFRYVAKPSRAERNAGCEHIAPVAQAHDVRSNACGRCGRNVKANGSGVGCECGELRETIQRARGGNHHPTVKSVALMRWLLRLVTKPGDVILDPFGGSGTTGVAALLEGRRVILVEREPAFAAIARARCAAADGSVWTAPVVARPREAKPQDERQPSLFAGGA